MCMCNIYIYIYICKFASATPRSLRTPTMPPRRPSCRPTSTPCMYSTNILQHFCQVHSSGILRTTAWKATEISHLQVTAASQLKKSCPTRAGICIVTTNQETQVCSRYVNQGIGVLIPAAYLDSMLDGLTPGWKVQGQLGKLRTHTKLLHPFSAAGSGLAAECIIFQGGF